MIKVYLKSIKSDNNCLITVVSYAQIAFKKCLFFRLNQPMRICSPVSVATRASNDSISDFTNYRLALLFRRQGYSAKLCIALSPIHKS